MKAGLVAVLLVVLGLGFSGCGEDADRGAVCDKMVSCGQFSTVDECELALGTMQLSSPCLKAMNSASCADHALAEPSYWAVCWDQCSVEAQHCSGDTMQYCDGTWELIFRCEGVCATGDGTYSGVCGTSYNGQTSETDVCWCE